MKKGTTKKTTMPKSKADCKRKSAGKNPPSSTSVPGSDHQTPAIIKLQLDYLQQEHAIKLKAIADRETIELSLARKKYYLLKSQMDIGSADVREFEACYLDTENTVTSVEDVNVPIAFEYNSSVSGRSMAGSSNAILTSEQICARQVMSGDLPTFSGDPQDWPVFYSQYKHTTSVCGYSNSENLVRLQRCIKGKALEYVRSRLLVPELVPKVIDTLEMLYGRPSILINSLINKARTIPPPVLERLETIIDYGMAIQNLFDHLKAMDQTVHLRNPTLMAELESKLPSEIKLEWARYKRQHAPSSLETLHEFMKEHVEAACELTHTGIEEHSSHFQNEPPNSEFELEPRSVAVNQVKSCIICNRQDHDVEECAQFRSYDVSRRWRLIGELKLCRCCLGRHASRVCRNANECGVDNCKLIHNPLLHQARI